MLDKNVEGELYNLRLKTKERDRKCFYKNCEQLAINSHVLQRQGILDLISENGHIYTYNFNKFSGDVEFRKTGISKALTFKGFCSKHDDLVFKGIEKTMLDLNDYQSALLISYRGLLHEIRKKEIGLDYFGEVKKLPIDFKTIEFHEGILELVLFNLNRYRRKIEYNIDNKKERLFKFYVLDAPKLDICASALYSLPSDWELKKIKREKPKEFNLFFLNLIPFKNKLGILFGYHRSDRKISEKYCKYLLSISKEKILKEINDWLIMRIESWVCSPSFYKKYIKQNEKKIIELCAKYTYNSSNLSETFQLDFNIFENFKL